MQSREIEKEQREDEGCIELTYCSSSQPYAFGVSLISVCSGILMYGRSDWGRW